MVGPVDKPQAGAAPVAATEQPYQVKKGDTLGSIAKAHNVGLRELVAANPQFDAAKLGGGLETGRKGDKGWDPDFIRPGDLIVIPRKAVVSQRPTPVATEEVGAQAGDVVEEPVAVERSVAAEAPKPMDPEQTLRPQTVAAEGTEKAGVTKTSDEAKEKGVWNTISKLLENNIFQGALGVLAAIPGIGQVISGVAAIVMLGKFLGDWVSNPRDGPNYKTLASALLYAVGVVMPGLGSYGGLMGMFVAREPGAKGEQAGANAAERIPAAEPAEAEPLSLEDVRAHTAATQKLIDVGLELDPEDLRSGAASAHALRAERDRILAEAGGSREAVSADQQAKLIEIDAVLEALPGAAMMMAQQVAFGFSGETFVASEAPTEGGIFQLAEGQDLSAVTSELELDEEITQDQAQAAILAYNGLTEPPVVGRPFYVPTASQITAHAGDGKLTMAEGYGHDLRLAVGRLIANTETTNPEEARALEELLRLLAKMSVQPREMRPEREAGEPPVRDGAIA